MKHQTWNEIKNQQPNEISIHKKGTFNKSPGHFRETIILLLYTNANAMLDSLLFFSEIINLEITTKEHTKNYYIFVLHKKTVETNESKNERTEQTRPEGAFYILPIFTFSWL